MKVSQLFQDERPSLQLGTLARSELWYDVLWPPGTAVSGVTELPERNGHGSGPNGDGTAFCLLGGSTVVLPGALLHGPLTYAVNGDERTVKPGCSDPFDTQSGDQGYAEVGSDRYRWATRPNARSAWKWRNQP